MTGGPVGEGAKYWLHVLTEIKNRGVNDVLMVVCDGLTGLPDAISAVWPQTITQTCVVHLLRNSFRYAGRQHYDAIAKALRPVYTAPTEAAAMERFLEFCEAWGERYPAIVRLWENAWAEFVPFLSFDVEIRKIICTTNAIESVNARIRRAVKARGHFPNEQAALKCVYMAIMSLDPTGDRATPLVDPLEARAERLRHRLRRTPLRRPEVDQQNISYTEKLTAPFTARLTRSWVYGSRGSRARSALGPEGARQSPAWPPRPG